MTEKVSTNNYAKGWSPGQVFMVRDSRSKGHGFKSWHCILDEQSFHIYLL